MLWMKTGVFLLLKKTSIIIAGEKKSFGL